MYAKLDKKHGKALYIQLYEAISEDIITGKLRSGIKLPPRRSLSEQLGISQNTVDSAYKMLLDTGYIISVPRQGYIVSFKTSVYDSKIPWEITAPEDVVFSPNGIDSTRINRAAYAKILKDIAYNDGTDIFSYVDKSGEFALRSAVSKYLYSFRNVKCPPDRIIIGAGAEYLLASLAALFSDDSVFIMENPCDTHFYRTIAAYKNKVITLPANIDKFDMDALYSSSGSILFLEPDARFPRSAALRDSERYDILNWAQQKDGRYIIENCCDSEIQWDSHRTIYSMDKNNKIIYLGAFARSLCPAVKTAYMVLPPQLLDLWKRRHVYYYALTSKVEQFTLAEFINKGHFTKHYKTMRRVYKEKREYLIECLSEAFSDKITVYGADGSTYINAALDGINPAEIKAAAVRSGVKLFSANSFNISKDKYSLPNDRLVIGFGDLTREKIKRGIRLLSDGLVYGHL